MEAILGRCERTFNQFWIDKTQFSWHLPISIRLCFVHAIYIGATIKIPWVSKMPIGTLMMCVTSLKNWYQGNLVVNQRLIFKISNFNQVVKKSGLIGSFDVNDAKTSILVVVFIFVLTFFLHPRSLYSHYSSTSLFFMLQTMENCMPSWTLA